MAISVGEIDDARAQEGPASYHDGHARPRALLHNPTDQLLYAALSTSDEVVAIDTQKRPARVVARIATGPYPQALELLPGGEVLVVCRYDAMLGVIRPNPQQRRADECYRRVHGGTVHGLRGAAVHRSGRIYVATPALSGVQAIDVESGVVQTVETGISPRAVHIVPDPRNDDELLLVSNFISHSLDVYALAADGKIGARLQHVTTQAPVQEFLLAPLPDAAHPTLLLLTHEDRPVDRSAPFVAGMDSVVLSLPAHTEAGAAVPFDDPGPGQRVTANLSDGPQPLVKLDSLAFDTRSRRLAIVGAASDNVLLTDQALTGPHARAVLKLRTGSNPVAVAFLPDGRLATADRLSDTISLISPSGRSEQVVVGAPARSSDFELGELLFYSRALLPHNVADGERSLYTCSGCHDDGHVDGRLHPSKLNRFQSMTKTCRGIGSTAPYLFLGEVADVEGFAANLLSTHAQGSDHYDTKLQLWRPSTCSLRPRTLHPDGIRSAMAAYLANIPAEPSPFLPFGATELPAEARRGLALFKRACANCHRLVADSSRDDVVDEADLEKRLVRGEVALTSGLLYDVGIKVLGKGGNNPPSLRGVWDNAPYFSDGSAKTLEDALSRSTLDSTNKAVHGAGPPALDAESRAALLAFLRCL